MSTKKVATEITFAYLLEYLAENPNNGYTAVDLTQHVNNNTNYVDKYGMTASVEKIRKVLLTWGPSNRLVIYEEDGQSYYQLERNVVNTERNYRLVQKDTEVYPMSLERAKDIIATEEWLKTKIDELSARVEKLLLENRALLRRLAQQETPPVVVAAPARPRVAPPRRRITRVVENKAN